MLLWLLLLGYWKGPCWIANVRTGAIMVAFIRVAAILQRVLAALPMLVLAREDKRFIKSLGMDQSSVRILLRVD